MSGAKGFVDGLFGNLLEGWAVGSTMERPAEVQILVDGTPCGTAVCDLFRADLSAAGLRNGYAKFQFIVPNRFWDGRSHQVTVVNLSSGMPLSESPRDFVFDPKVLESHRGIIFTSFKDDSKDGFFEAIKSKRRAAVIASFSSQRHLFSYHRSLIQRLASAGYVVIQVHSEAGTPLEEVADTSEGLSCLIRRGNNGYDFGSWAAAVAMLAEDWESLDELLLLNDSNFGKVDLILPVLERFKGNFVCLTDSYERRYHAQSYFMLFRKAAVHEGAVLDFFERYQFPTSKEEVIRLGELGLTGDMLARGVELTPLCPYERVAGQWLDEVPETVALVRSLFHKLGLSGRRLLDDRLDQFSHIVDSIVSNRPVNPSHFFWRTLIRQFNHPFVKRELIMKNPAKVPDLMLAFMTDEVAHVLDNAEVLQYARLEGGSPIVEMERRFGSELAADAPAESWKSMRARPEAEWQDV